jgi:hypothetical protein
MACHLFGYMSRLDGRVEGGACRVKDKILHVNKNGGVTATQTKVCVMVTPPFLLIFVSTTNRMQHNNISCNL